MLIVNKVLSLPPTIWYPSGGVLLCLGFFKDENADTIKYASYSFSALARSFNTFDLKDPSASLISISVLLEYSKSLSFWCLFQWFFFIFVRCIKSFDAVFSESPPSNFTVVTCDSPDPTEFTSVWYFGEFVSFYPHIWHGNIYLPCILLQSFPVSSVR